LGLIAALNNYTDLKILPINCLWSFENPAQYIALQSPILFLRPHDFYSPSKSILEYLIALGTKLILFDTVDTALKLAPLFKKHGFHTAILFHNIDHVLFERLGYKRELVNQAASKTIEALNLLDIAFVRSDIDLKHLSEISRHLKTVHIARGGIDTDSIDFRQSRGRVLKAIVIANFYYEPNLEGLLLLLKYWNGGELRIVGPLPQNIRKEIYRTKNVKYVGKLLSIQAELNNATIGLIPVNSGSGTRMKALDYAAAGLPILSTTIGMEGLEDLRNFVYLENKIENFNKRAPEIILDSDNPSKVSGARRLMNEIYDWKTSIQEYYSPIATLIQAK